MSLKTSTTTTTTNNNKTNHSNTIHPQPPQPPPRRSKQRSKPPPPQPPPPPPSVENTRLSGGSNSGGFYGGGSGSGYCGGGEELVQYWLFPHTHDGTPITDKTQLDALVTKYMAHVAQYTHTYIWHHQGFSVRVGGWMEEEEEEGEDGRKKRRKRKRCSCDDEEIGGVEGGGGAHLCGVTGVGDYMEDEWFIVFLLVTLTRDFPGLVCRVVDSDGEFLLVEAADHLPAWVNPETARQRVYIHGGQIHLLPLAVSPSTLTPHPHGTPPTMQAASSISTLPPSLSLAPPPLQDAIVSRISGYPGRISTEQHVAHAYVPVAVAALLREYPTLLGPAIHTFCRRDAIDNKVLRVMRHFPPETRVRTAVRFSKALYAQLAAHPFTPDHRVGWDLPRPNNPDYKVHDLGMKLACGFEIMVCSAGGVNPSTPTDSTPNTTTDNTDPRWLRYHKALTEKGYFRGELPGSKLYKSLEENAHQYFVTHVLSGQGSASQDGDDLSVGAMVVKLLSKVNIDHEFYKERSTRLIPADDDSWLQITPDALEHMLESRYGKDNIPRGATDQEMMESLTTFLGQASDLEGVEVPQQRKVSTLSVPKRKPSGGRGGGKGGVSSGGGRKISGNTGVSSSSASGLLSPLSSDQLRKVSAQSTASDVSCSSEMSSFSTKIDFNAESFSDAMTNILESGVPEDDYWCGSEDDSSGMSSYEGEEGADVSLSRKTSNTSTTSNTSSNSSSSSSDNNNGNKNRNKKNSNTKKSDRKMREYMRQMEEELAGTKIADTFTSTANTTTTTDGAANNSTSKGNHNNNNSSSNGIRSSTNTSDDDDDDDEFGDVEDFRPVKVDLQAVKNLVKSYSAQNGMPGPASTLLASVGMKPKSS